MTDFAAARQAMVDCQVRPSDVTRYAIIEAMLWCPRERFVAKSRAETAYAGAEIPLGSGRVLLEPRTLAKMLDAVNVEPGDVVLDIGTGLGYSAALISRMAEAVVALEDLPELARDAESVLAEIAADNVAVVEGSLQEGAAKHGPYDAIFIQGGIERLPDGIASQLKEGGRIAAIFMDGELGTCRIGYRLDGAMSWRFAFNAAAPVLEGFEAAHSFAL